MAQEPSSQLPQYYGQTMADGTMVGSPKIPLGSHSSRDALLRLPIQPGAAHVHHPEQDPISPISAVPASPLPIGIGNASASAGGGRTRSRSRPRGNGDSSRWIVPHASVQEQEDEYYRQNHRTGRSSMSHRSAYVEEYSDEDDRPRAYRRPARRHTRPPPAHGRAPTVRYSVDQSRRSMDAPRESYEYESDTPTKARFNSTYGYGYYSDGEDDGGYRRPRTAYGGGGRRGPPRNPPSTEEVMRIPWTMWMNSNAKNRRSHSYPQPCSKLRPNPFLHRSRNLPAFVSKEVSELFLPSKLQRRVLIL